MKSKVLIATSLALAAVLLLQQNAPDRDALPAPLPVAVQDGLPGQPSLAGVPGAPGSAPLAAGFEPPAAGPRFGRHQAVQGVQRVHWVSGESGHPTQPASMPSGAAASHAPQAGAGMPAPIPRPATAASEAPDWRDSARELLSQIGVLCPAAGCDSLEDD